VTGGNSRIDAGNVTLQHRQRDVLSRPQRRDVTDRVRSMVRGGRLSISVNKDVPGGDPAPNVPKDLRLVYPSGRGREREVQVNEGPATRGPVIEKSIHRKSLATTLPFGGHARRPPCLPIKKNWNYRAGPLELARSEDLIIDFVGMRT
jgi:hypothetical protein